MSAVPLLPAGLRNVGWRYLLVRRWQSLFMIIGIMLGVAVMVAIDMANASAERAFVLSSEAVTGKTTHQILGGPDGLDEQVYVQLQRDGISYPAAPVLSDYVSSPQLGNQPLQLLGIDPFVDAPFRSYLNAQGTPDVNLLMSFLTQPGAVLLSRSLADRYGFKPGDSFPLVVGGQTHEAYLAGTLDPSDTLTRRSLEGVILADISTAQELTGRLGKIDRIDLILPENSAQAEGNLKASLPQGTRLVSVASRSGAVAEMTSAFRLNLSALSLLALVVGLFLIYNTMTFSVVQRRALFGTLRCLGVVRREVFLMVLGEAFIAGVIGSGLGVVLGLLLGRSTVGMVTQTVNDLYFTTTVQSVGIPIQSLVKGGVVGLMATVATALPPAWEAASIPPTAALSRSGLESKAHIIVRWVSIAGLVLIAAGLVFFSLPGGHLYAGFGGTFAILVGFALLSALLLLVLMRLLTPITGRLFGLLGRIAPRNLVNTLSRTSVAVASLMVAVAVTIGVNLMIDSFRYTVVVWLDQTLIGDVYINVPSFSANVSLAEIDPKAVQVIENWPGAGQVFSLRSVQVDSRQGPVQLSASSNVNVGNERLYSKVQGNPRELDHALGSGSILISEPLANRLNLKLGDSIELATADGWHSFPIAGIFYDYSSSEGSVLMYLPVYRQFWKENGITAMSLRLPSDSNADQVTAQLQDTLSGIQQLYVRPNQALKRDVMAVFDRTFAITAALRILATLVAFVGILSTLLLLQMEKQREIGIFRALGLTGKQLWELVMMETGLMGLAAGLFAMPAGYALALILVYIINLRSFGWTLQMAINPVVFLQALGVALLAALLAGIYPAWKMSRMAAAEAVRYE